MKGLDAPLGQAPVVLSSRRVANVHDFDKFSSDIHKDTVDTI